MSDPSEILEELRRRLEVEIRQAFKEHDKSLGHGLCQASEMVKDLAREHGITLDFQSSFVD